MTASDALTRAALGLPFEGNLGFAAAVGFLGLLECREECLALGSGSAAAQDMYIGLQTYAIVDDFAVLVHDGDCGGQCRRRIGDCFAVHWGVEHSIRGRELGINMRDRGRLFRTNGWKTEGSD